MMFFIPNSFIITDGFFTMKSKTGKLLHACKEQEMNRRNIFFRICNDNMKADKLLILIIHGEANLDMNLQTIHFVNCPFLLRVYQFVNDLFRSQKQPMVLRFCHSKLVGRAICADYSIPGGFQKWDKKTSNSAL